MKDIEWDDSKNNKLKAERGVSFDELLSDGKLIDYKNNPSRENQKVMLFDYKNYVWVVPCVEEDSKIFLKTLFQSRKYTKQLLKGKKDEAN